MKYNPLREEATSTVFRTKFNEKETLHNITNKIKKNKHQTYHEHEKLWKNFKSSHIEESKRSSFDVQENSKKSSYSEKSNSNADSLYICDPDNIVRIVNK